MSNRPESVVFVNDELLGGTTLVVPAGTKVVIPGSIPLEWSGFNTASLKAHITGLSPGDSFKTFAVVIDPESPTFPILQGFPLPELFEAKDADGDYAGTLYLPSFFGSPGTQIAIPYDVGVIGTAWFHPGQPTFLDAMNTPGFFCEFTRGIGSGGALTASIHLQTLVDPGVDTGFSMFLTQRSDMTDTVSSMSTHADQPGHVNIVTRDYGCPTYVPPPVVDGGNITGSFVEYEIPFTALEAAVIDFTKDLFFTWVWDGQIFNGAQTHWDMTALRFQCPGGAGGGGKRSMIPFYYNKIVLDATNCAGDVTVSLALLEMTNARRVTGVRLI